VGDLTEVDSSGGSADASEDVPTSAEAGADAGRDVVLPPDAPVDGIKGDSPGDSSDGSVPPTCDGGLTACSGLCVDTTHDTHNCGACGHDCLGGACTSSACQPEVLASGLIGSVGIALSPSAVYVTLLLPAPKGAIVTVPLAGGAAIPIVTGQNQPRHVAVDALHVYWTNRLSAGAVGMANLDGSNVITLAASNYPWDVTVDSSDVYWTEQNSLGRVLSCAIGGCGGVPKILANGRASPSGIAVLAGTVYWAESSRIATCPSSGCPVTGPAPFATGLNQPNSVASNGTDLAWADEGDGAIWVCPLAACAAPTKLALGQQGGLYAKPIAIDSSTVYWTDGVLGRILSCAISGCGGTPTVRASGQSAPGIAVDATAIYWTDTAGGTITRLAK
jgi:hypothetical protein